MRAELTARHSGASAADRAGDLESVLRDLLGERLATWSVRRDGTRLRVVPPAAPTRTQGWTLHLSAAVAWAPIVLRRATTALVAEKCPFEIAADPDVPSGPFLTAYPRDDAQLCRLASALDAANAGLAGPQLHLRYGPYG